MIRFREIFFNNKVNSLSLLVSILFFYSCNFDDEVAIRDYIKLCATDLIQRQLDSSVRRADYYYEEQMFTMYIDSAGKPVFYKELPINSIILHNGDEVFEVELIDGFISVEKK